MSQKFIGGAEQARINARNRYNRRVDDGFDNNKNVRENCGRPMQRRNLKVNAINSSNSPATRYHASLLTCSVQEMASSRNDDRTMIEVMHCVCERAGVDLPSNLPVKYHNAEDYYSMHASLLLEESRFILSEILSGNQVKCDRGELRPLWLELIGMDAPKKKKVGFTLQFENKVRGHATSFDIDQVLCMKPGGVFQVSLDNAGKYTPAPNETVRITMLACITPGYNEGDITERRSLSLTVFPTEKLLLRLGTMWKIEYLTSLVNEQRQFEACIQRPKVAFIHTLLGWETNTHTRFDETDGNNNTKHNDDSSAIRKVFLIPKLNSVQEKAAVQFLQSPPSSVTLVQGPPGTGKTTFLASLLFRNLCSVRNDGTIKINQKKRILVTAPTNKAVLVLALKFLSFMKDSTALNIVMIGVESKLISRDESGTDCDSFSSANLSPSLRSIFVYTWLDEMTKEFRSFSEFLHPQSYSPGKRRSLTNRASILARRFHNSLPSLVEKTGSLFWVQEFITSLQKLPTDVPYPNDFYDCLTRTRECLTNFVDTLDQIDRFVANQELLDVANIIFCTLATSGVAAMKRTRRIDDLFVDEAAAATEPEMMVPFHLRPERMLAVGDPKQLPATLMSRHAINLGLDRSLIGRLMFNCSHEYTMLDKQYRMRPEIRSLPSKLFYGGKIIDADNVVSPDYRGKLSILEGKPYSFLQVKGCEERSAGQSYYNIQEAEAVVEIVRSICLASKKVNWSGSWYSPDKIRVITFYGAQVSCINRLLNKNGFGQVLCATVDSSQGCEADIVIISFVRSNHERGKTPSAGFLQDERRMNVSLTRAKFQLICIGDADNTLFASGIPVLRAIINDAKSRGVISNFKSCNEFLAQKEYTGHAKEQKRWNNSGPSNIKTDHTKHEPRKRGRDIAQSNASTSCFANDKEQSRFMKESSPLISPNSCNLEGNNITPELKSKSSHTDVSISNTSFTSTHKGHVKHSGFSNISTSSILESEQKKAKMNDFPSKVSASVSALAKEYIGYMKAPEKREQHLSVIHNSLSRNSRDESNVLQGDQDLKQHQIKSMKDTQAEKARKKALLEKIALLQKEADAIDG